MFSHAPRCRYQRNQLGEVICQLRFPEILKIGTELPADFQEAIREYYPQYLQKMENPAPKITGTPGNLTLQNAPSSVNYQFSSRDGLWRVNLTAGFVSLSCSRYTCWEEFADKLDGPLAALIRIYKVPYFDRIGLRYLNFFSRTALELEGTSFAELIADCYLGPMGDGDVSAESFTRCSTDVELPIRGGCRAKIHAGPGLLQQNGKSDKEVRFVFDQDIFMPGQTDVSLTTGVLNTLHGQADSIFRGAITDRLHRAMLPDI